MHGFTFSHHPVTAAACLATLEILERERLVERAAVMGERALARLQRLRARPHVGDVRGRGLMLAVELVADTRTRRPFPRAERRAETVAARAFAAGLVVYPSAGCATGTEGDVVMLAPPFVVTEEELEEMAGILDGADRGDVPLAGGDDARLSQAGLPAAGTQGARGHRARRARDVPELPQGLPAGGRPRARGRWSRTRTATATSTSRPASRWSRPATAIPTWWPPSSAQAERFLHMCATDFYYENVVALAEGLARRAPGPGPWRVFFANSGAEVVEAAIKLARLRTGPPEDRRLLRGLPRPHLRRHEPHREQARAAPRLRAAPAGGAAHPLRLLLPLPGQPRPATLQRGVPRPAHGDDVRHHRPIPSEIAAVIVEPVQGEGGYVVPHPGFLPRLREVTRRHGILLIADEVQCGMGRTGRMFASEHFGLEPDIITLAKGIASGMPLGALHGARRRDALGERRPRLDLRRQPRLGGGRPGHPASSSRAG